MPIDMLKVNAALNQCCKNILTVTVYYYKGGGNINLADFSRN